MTGQFVGSPAYAAPEALVKGMTGAASDVYGLGATLYQAAAGRWPRLEARGAILAPVPPLAELAPQLPAHVAAAIDRAIALDHEKRPTAAELADLIAGGGAISAASVAPQTGPVLAAPAAPASGPVVTQPMTDTATRSGEVHAKPRWQPFAVVFAIVVVLVAIGKCGAGGDKPGAVAPATPHDDDQPPLRPGEIRIVPPEGLEANTRAQREWDKVVDQIYKRHYGEAREKLEEWEEHFGPTSETTELRRQLESLPDEGEGRGRKHKH
jgi:hypothetical protein